MSRIVKKALHSLLTMVLVLGAVIMSSSTIAYADHDPDAVQFAGGDGTPGTPYLIATPEQLNEVRNHLSDYFQLIADIDLTAYLGTGGDGWVPIGPTFSGAFDGNHHTISGLRISNYSGNGLFRHINGSAEIKNFGLIDVDITCGQNCGGLVGINEGNISNSFVTGSVYVDKETGGLVGSQSSGGISNSYANVNVNGTQYAIGGLVGLLSGGSISNSYAAGSVHGSFNVGGLVGSFFGGNVTNSFYDVDTTGQSDTGKGTGLETSYMQDKSTYENAGWDFDADWNIDTSGNAQRHNNGYPYLRASQAYVTYDGNDNTEGVAPFDATSYRPSRSASIAGNTGGLARTGYTFAGWNTASDGSGTSYDEGDMITIGASGETLYAQWLISLSGLSLSSGSMSPAFSSATAMYTASVPYSVSSLTVTPTAVDANATITVNGIATDSGTASGSINLSVGNNTITVVVTALDGTDQTFTITVARASAPSSGGEEVSTASEQTDPNTTDLIVRIDGETQEAIATATTSDQDGRTVVTVMVDAEKLIERLDQAGDKPVVTIPVSSKADKVSAALTGDIIKAMENKNAILEIQTPNGSYSLPASEVLIDQLSEQLGAGANLESVTLFVDVANSDNEKVELLAKAADKSGFTVVVPPVDFKITAEFDNKTVQVTKFNSFVEREITIPEGVDTSKITTAVVLNDDGTTRSVPTKIVNKDGVTYAVINSLTNSTYSLVWHPVQFKDVANHWANNAINDMGSRMIISGDGNGSFHPDQAITRAEFAAIMVRGLGLAQEAGPAPFSDVDEGSWYSNVIHTAHAYNLIHGFDDGTFRPNQQITREQAMAMIAKAMEVTGLSDQLAVHDSNTTLQSYVDEKQVSLWARDSVAAVLQVGIITGRSSSQLAPKAFITRAEVAVIIQRLLKQSELI